MASIKEMRLAINMCATYYPEDADEDYVYIYLEAIIGERL